MRSSADISTARIGRPRRRIWLVVAFATLVVLFFALKWFAWLYTQSLWYSSINQHDVFTTMLATKVGLFLVFGLVFFLVMWGNLLLCNRLGPSELFLDAPEDELVRRFQAAVRPYAGRLYALLSFVLAVIAASTTLDRWQQYLLFANAKNFGIKDPLFGKDLGFYVFRLPFLTFVVDWVLASLLAVIVFTAVFHYLNGGIRAARVTPRVAPGVKVHLSVLLALLALFKAAGYILARWHMVTSTSSNIFEGAGYTDVHARLPALLLLALLCLLAAVILLFNIWQRGWTLPIIAVGLWAFVALLLGVIYPAILQAVKVTPAQSSLELPYIARNINATREAYGLNGIGPGLAGPIGQPQSWSATTTKPPLQQPGVAQSVADIRQWDPSATVAQQTFQQLEGLRNYYAISSIGEDRYLVHGKLVPVDEGIRELNLNGVPNPTWVTQHLQYTHGLGVVLAPSNLVNPSTHQPVFTESGVPPSPGIGGFPQVGKTTAGVYFGLNQTGFVVVDTNTKELDYDRSGSSVYTHYKCLPQPTPPTCGGVPAGGFFRRLMFAVRFTDPNLVLSNLITPKSRIIYMRNVVQIAQQAAPFLSIDDHPYAVIDGGHLDWVLDGYTTTDQYPYSQNASTQLVPGDTGLPSSYNYARNSVKIVVDAYTGRVTLYDMDPHDPILQAWSTAFPHLVHPIAEMDPTLRAHLKYPEDIFSIQAAIYGRYHVTNPASFYQNNDGWSLSPTNGVTAANTPTIQLTQTQNRQGLIVSQNVARMDPLYQIYALPGSPTPQYTLTDAYVAATSNAASAAANPGVLNLTAFMVALSDPKHYGSLRVYRPSSDASVYGPLLAESKMVSNPAASRQITLHTSPTGGSTATLGNVLMVPIDGSMLYVCPMYVSSQATPYPLLQYEMAVYKTHTGFSTSLRGALAQVLAGVTPPKTHGTQTVGQLLAAAASDFARAKVALQNGNLGLYQQLNSAASRALTEAEALYATTRATVSPKSS